MRTIEEYKAYYLSFFSVEEFSSSRRVVLIAWILLFFQLYLFQELMGTAAGTVKSFTENVYTCWPYAPRCGEWYFFLRPPSGYSLPFTYTVATVLFFYSAYALYVQRYVAAHLSMLVLCVSEALFLFFLSYNIGETYMYLHVLLLALLLCAPYKIWTLTRLMVMGYVAAGVTTAALLIAAGGHIPPLWLIPDSLETLLVYSVIAVECVGALYLLSTEVKTKKLVLLFLLTVHFYAAIVFEYQYFILVAPLLFVLFSREFEADQEREPHVRFRTAAIVCAVVVMGGIHVYLIEKAATYQFTFVRPHIGVALWFPPTSGISTMTLTKVDGTQTQRKDEWTNRPCKCSPYTRLFEIKNMCARDASLQSVQWSLTVRGIDGVWRNIVSTTNACALSFSFLKHNGWIQPKVLNNE